MKRIYFIGLLAILASAYQAAAQYSSPESAIYDAVGSRWLISNAGSGRIVERSEAGDVRAFATNMDGPKGLAILGDTLYVADVTRIRAYRLTTRAALYTINVPNSTFLNDCVSDGAYLYVSEMVRHRIYRFNLTSHEVSQYVTDNINSPNGLYYDSNGNRLVMVSYRENSPIQQVNLADGSVELITNTQFSDLDGITRDGNGNWYVSSWATNAVYRFNADFSEATMLEDGYDGPADIYYSKVGNILAIPCMNVHRVVFRHTPPPEAELRIPLLIDFGETYIHTVLEHTIAWQNTGGDSLFIDSVSHTGSGFRVELPQNFRLGPEEFEDALITFEPTDSVDYTDTIYVYSNEPLTPRTLILKGKGLPAPWLRMQDSYDFGRVVIGGNANINLLVANAGLEGLVLDSVVTHVRAFGVRLPNQRRVPAGDSTTISVSFNPASEDEFTDTTWIYSSSIDSPHKLVLTGTGIRAARLGIPQRYDFGTVELGDSSVWVMHLQNIGGDTLTIDSVNHSDGVFTVSSPEVLILAPNVSTTATVVFKPSQDRVYNDRMNIYSNDPASPGVVQLVGAGDDTVSLARLVTPERYDFGSVDRGDSSVWVMQFRNIGADTLRIDSITHNEPDFSVSMPQRVILAPNSSTSSTVTFRPTEVKAYADSLLVYCNDPAAPLKTILSGTGREPDGISHGIVPLEFDVSEAYPSPFNSSAEFRLSLPKADNVVIRLYDETGRVSREIVSRNIEAGVHLIPVEGSGLPDGVYFLKGSAGSQQFTRKLVLLR